MARWTILLVCILPLSGCMSEEGLELTLSDVPGQVMAGEPFSFTMTGEGAATSTHVGAHFWTASTQDPTGDFDLAGGCAHIPDGTTFPDAVTVTCTIDEPGTIYLRGHVRTDETNYWSAEFVVDIFDFELSTAETFSTASVGEAATFDLIVEGDVDLMTDHVGAHYFDSDVQDPTASFDDQAGACAHAAGEVPGTYSVSCSFTEAGTYYVFGHLRVDGHNFWAPSFEVVVS